MIAFIYKPARTAMQSGMAKTDRWLLEFKDHTANYIDPLMGWSGSRNTTKQLKLWFQTQDDAIAYADQHNMSYILQQPHQHVIRAKSYADNFKPKV